MALREIQGKPTSPFCLVRTAANDATLYRVPKMDETNTGGQSARQHRGRSVQRGIRIYPTLSAKSLAAIVYCGAPGAFGRWLQISEIIITPTDTKVSIGTFVQLIRRLTSGPIKESRLDLKARS
jgi:hypothetical protein